MYPREFNARELIMPSRAPNGAYRTSSPAKLSSGTGAAAHAFDVPACRGPDCGYIPLRRRRRAIDYVSSAFVPVRRYRCLNQLCAWEGDPDYSHSRLRPTALWNILVRTSLTGQDRR